MTTLQRLARSCRVALRGQTYRNILYLLLAFPLGLSYFIVLVTGFATGLGLAILGVGLLLLLLMFGFSWTMAVVERYLVMTLLRVTIAPPSGPPWPSPSRWAWIKAHLRRPVTWKSLCYLLVEFPFGVAAFCVTVSLAAVSTCLLLYPVAYLFVPSDPTFNAFTVPHAIWRDVPHPFALIPLLTLFVLIPALGVCVTVASMHALNGLAYGWGHFARVMLGMSTAEQHVAEARVKAAREQARAEHADQRRRELIVNVSHELRTPIANVRGHIETLRMAMGEHLSEAEKQHYLAIAAREAERLGVLVDELLSLARADADELQLDVRPVAVDAVVEEVYQTLAPLAHRDRQVTLLRAIAADLPRALADRDRLIQVLLNLARNAVTATPVGGLVFLDLERADADQIALCVSDTGHGIPPEDLERIFERFYRADAARQRATGGFGLGLSIVRDLVQAMGGAVTVTSTVGEGSCFRVMLRVAPPTP